MGIKIIRRLRDLLDVDTTGASVGDRLTLDADGETWVAAAPSGGAGAAVDIAFTPAGNIAATDVQAALEELDTEKAATSHVHAGEDITSGTVADARIASTIARDSEVTAAIAAHEGASDPHPTYTTAAELASAVAASEAGQVRDGDAAGGVLGGTYPNPSFAADMATQAELDAHVTDSSAAHAASAISASSTTLSGTGADVQAVLEELDNLLDDHSARHEDGGADEISIAGLSGTPAALQTHLDDTTAAHAASAVAFTPAGTIAATDVQAAIEEVAAEAGGSGGMTVLHDEVLGSDGTFDVSSIPAGYGTLLLELHVKGSTTQQNLLARFNGDTGGNYDIQIQTTSGSTVAAAGSAGTTSMHIGYVQDTGTAGHASACTVEIPDYDDTSFHKYLTSRQAVNISAFYMALGAACWHSTAAVNRIEVFPGAGNFKAGSRLTIYGLGE